MGREATKAGGKPWYECRMEAAKWDGRLSSREGAADLLGMSVSALADAELELSKCMPPDKAVRMAELYNAPHLLNYYCLKQCPIGKNKPLSEEVLPIERVTVKLMKGTKAKTFLSESTPFTDFLPKKPRIDPQVPNTENPFSEYKDFCGVFVTSKR